MLSGDVTLRERCLHFSLFNYFLFKMKWCFGNFVMNLTSFWVLWKTKTVFSCNLVFASLYRTTILCILWFLKSIRRRRVWVSPCAEASCARSELWAPGCRWRSSQPSCAGRSQALRRRKTSCDTAADWTWSLENSSAGGLHSVPPSDETTGGEKMGLEKNPKSFLWTPHFKNITLYEELLLISKCCWMRGQD